MSAVRWLRALLPFAVTAGIFALISQRVDWSKVAAHLGPEALPVFGPALLVYIVASLTLDALSLMRTRTEATPFTRWARLKGATYPVNVLHYALGSAALILLLRRRAGLTLADATGTALMIAGLDTVTASLTCMLSYLARHPEQRARILADPALLPSAIEEMMRFESPVAEGSYALGVLAPYFERDCLRPSTPSVSWQPRTTW